MNNELKELKTNIQKYQWKQERDLSNAIYGQHYNMDANHGTLIKNPKGNWRPWK